jgi:hypothetical protein
MIDLLITLLRILFPLDPVARLREITRDYINAIVSCLEDPIRREAIRNTPHLCAKLDADIAVLEHGIHLLIHERARQILGLPYTYTPRIPSPEPRRARPLTQIIARLGRMATLFHNLERLAQRRATRMKLEHGASPLRLDASHRSTSPMLRMVENLSVMREVLHRLRRGRWIARACAQDGGGSLRTRGPPPKLRCSKSNHAPRKLSFRGRTRVSATLSRASQTRSARHAGCTRATDIAGSSPLPQRASAGSADLHPAWP